MSMKKLLFCSPSPKTGHVKALSQNWPVGGLARDTFVPPPSLALTRSGRGPPPPQHSPQEWGLAGKGLPETWAGTLPEEAGHSSIFRRAPG